MTRSDYWYKNAVIYCVDIETFADSDGDGVGDIRGLISRLDYLDRLGIDCLWLLPFYPSPNRDNGYDVEDYYGVDSRYGTLGDFVDLVREAKSRGIRIMIDLVGNHTSDQHPWFQAARRGEDPYRDYYVWSEDPPEPDAEPIFPDEEDSVWTYDERAEAYYYHRFYRFEPGLDLSNPDVRAEIKRIVGFWSELGVSGFRFDAAPVMIRKKGLESTEMDDPHDVFRDIREYVRRRSDDVMLLGEVGGAPEEVRKFFDDQMDTIFNFLQTGYVFHSLATEDAVSLSHGLKILPSIPEHGQWVNFLRNHDELNLEWLTQSQREEVFEEFAPDPEMRVFERGVRRRLAPMLDGDDRRIRMALSLLFSLPGAPLLYYGEEIGMGEDLSLEGREAVRTPMQWADEENAGFSAADPEELVMPVTADGRFGYEEVNVRDQRFDDDSLMNWVERLTRTRKELPEIGWGETEILDTASRAVFAHRCSWEGRTFVAVHNLSDEDHTASLDVGEHSQIVDLLGGTRSEVEDGTASVELEPYGCRWFGLEGVQESMGRSGDGA